MNGTQTVLDKATAYLRGGLSIIPIRADGSKAPTTKWERFQEEPPAADRLPAWWASGRNGIALVCGMVSGGREVIDFDLAELFDMWRELVEAQAPGLVARLPLVRTPRPGFQLHYNCPEIEGNQDLARDFERDAEGEPVPDPKTGKPKIKALIETRGEGGYVLLPGSPPNCHKTGRPYEHVAGPPLTEAPTITPDERSILLDAARSLDRLADDRVDHRTGRTVGPATAAGTSLSPGDDFNRRGPDWAAILDGWEVVRQSGSARYWRRPGKDGNGWSATTGVCTSAKGWDLLYIFSTNADPFEARRPYSKFAAYALLKHGGDFRAAAGDLARQGYGKHRKVKRAGRGQAAADVEAKGSEELDALAIIMAHFRQEYDPTFRRGNVMYSARLGREVKPGEACFAPGRGLIDKLMFASNVPTDTQGGVKENAIPQFFRNWAPSAWTDILRQLPEEEAAAEIVELAQEQFRAELSKAMKRMITLAFVRDGVERKETRA